MEYQKIDNEKFKGTQEVETVFNIKDIVRAKRNLENNLDEYKKYRAAQVAAMKEHQEQLVAEIDVVKAQILAAKNIGVEEAVEPTV